MLNMQSNKQLLGATSSLGHPSGALLHQYGLRNLKMASSYSVYFLGILNKMRSTTGLFFEPEPLKEA